MYSASSAGAECSGFRLTDTPPILFDVRKLLVMAEIVLRHSACGESLFKLRAHPAPIELAEASDGLDRFSFIRHNKARYPIINYFRHGSGAESDDGRAAGHRLD